MSKDTTTSNGIGFFGILTIVFIVLKLTKYIDWSWWWVLSPMLIPIVICLLFIVVFGLLFLIKQYSK